ncbi:Vps9p RAB5 like RAB GTpase binding involved in vacuolar sorting [Cryptosporidium sp. chipmunk genotype I]|uniref:Vps9p RAB5 like RAB GTpase binding involved in vacuolar sorting n=1 Tax=Cryptosporidium sp. chipmunk genotype I TaxID=1280935 RepID=UPI00351A73F6|nr:Vps9p RAB5 like RAB GTpase binding involved in vacuolar sorting [Cryptosporidium sp. chipmunk genotype I]
MKLMEYSDSVTGSPNDLYRSDFDGVQYNNESPGLRVEIGNSKEFVNSEACEGLEIKPSDEGSNSGGSMENQQTKSVAPYNRFLILLKDKMCSEIVFFVAKFIQQYPRLDEGLLDLIYGESRERFDLEEIINGNEDIGTQALANILHSFVRFCGDLLKETRVFGKVGNEEEEKIFIIEGLEKLVTTKLYNVLFDAVSFENDDADHYLFRKLKVLKTFVKLDHFDISKQYVETLQSDSLWLDICKNELCKFIRVKSPKDKVVLIVNICKILLSYMNKINKMKLESDSNSGDERIPSPPAADDLLPLLIFCIIQSNPTKIKAHIEFISLFRNSILLVSEDLYFFTHFYSAITFLEKLDGRQIQLNIDNAIFEEQFKSSEKKLFGNNLLHLLMPYSESRLSFQEKQNRLQEITSKLSSLKLSFEDYNSSDELKIGDIPQLFQEYKQLLNLFKELKQNCG